MNLNIIFSITMILLSTSTCLNVKDATSFVSPLTDLLIEKLQLKYEILTVLKDTTHDFVDIETITKNRDTILRLVGKKFKFVLRSLKAKSLELPISITYNGSPILKFDGNAENCSYYGEINDGAEDSIVSVNQCDGKLTGFILNSDGAYVVRSLDDDFRNLTHVITFFNGSQINQTCGVNENLPSLPINYTSENRLVTPKTVETAIFATNDLLEEYNNELEMLLQIILTAMDSVQKIFSHSRLMDDIRFKINSINIWGKNEGIDTNSDPVEYLKEFSTYQQSENSHWDHAILLTGLDFRNTVTGESKLGISYLNGMCDPERSVTISVGNHPLLATIIAHELGHSFGAVHDGQGNDCEGGIMSARLGSITNKLRWSECSKNMIKNLIRSKAVECLNN